MLRGQKAMARPAIATPARTKSSDACLSHVMAGMESAMAAPRKQMRSDIMLMPARKVPNSEQQQQHQTRGLHRQHLLKAWQKHKVHRHQDGHPMRDLGPDQVEPRLALRRIGPSSGDAHKPHCDRQELPIAVDRVAGEITIGHAEYGERQRHHKRQVAQQSGHREESVRSMFKLRFQLRLRRRIKKVVWVGHRPSNLRWSAKMFTRRRLRAYLNNATASDLAPRKSWRSKISS